MLVSVYSTEVHFLFLLSNLNKTNLSFLNESKQHFYLPFWSSQTGFLAFWMWIWVKDYSLVWRDQEVGCIILCPYAEPCVIVPLSLYLLLLGRTCVDLGNFTCCKILTKRFLSHQLIVWNYLQTLFKLYLFMYLDCNCRVYFLQHSSALNTSHIIYSFYCVIFLNKRILCCGVSRVASPQLFSKFQ